MGRTSKFVECIKEALKKGYLEECFTAKDVKAAFKRLCTNKNEDICCNFADNTFSTFLSKHKKGNERKYNEYFEKCEKEGFVSIFFNNLKYVKVRKNCLDYGCGSGNNAQVLKDFFENLYLVDISKTALELASKRLNINKSNCDKFINPNLELFDFILAWQVLYYNDSKSIIRMINNFYDNMKRGILMCSIVTPIVCKVTLSKKVSSNEYVITDKIPQQKGAKIYACETIDEFIALFEKKFKILDYGKFCNISFLKKERSMSEWYLLGEKI